MTRRIVKLKKFGRETAWGVGKVLGFLYEFGEYMSIKEISKSEIYRHVYGNYEGRVSKKQVSDLFYNLKRQKYIEEVGEDHSIILTDKAKIKIIEKMIEKSKNDRQIRLLSFDIPERLHVQRDYFRRAIKRIGFRQIQQSLWAIDRDVSEAVETVIKYYKLEDYVVYIIAEKTNIDLMIKNIFSK
ncbi:hypothetical protein COT78_01820 [Candidatus Berkelbacteria bacterium CG10_big_fil_rev_8_21_14_0_10_43_13]|uniref:Transcriptional repressor PaaX-like central Cas2-like domain-containing protein n=1 Tax=Candidatus Berkelbacteria bacterium CG10_big_fil_rev_8_21_14_0_10_43_13 TaxID=1974514 RepID=A0A2H0W6R0_9BACT|nr:MAG: hypothetical protein COT78_01820 [Candidatus Berkelbacteria bacterium CG10_big_fil_rev_8_21_14_0_10_43_13]